MFTFCDYTCTIHTAQSSPSDWIDYNVGGAFWELCCGLRPEITTSDPLRMLSTSHPLFNPRHEILILLDASHNKQVSRRHVDIWRIRNEHRTVTIRDTLAAGFTSGITLSITTAFSILLGHTNQTRMCSATGGYTSSCAASRKVSGQRAIGPMGINRNRHEQ